MLLAIDVGNTHTVLGVFKADQLLADWRISTANHRTADESWLIIRSFCADKGLSTDSIQGVGISSVVPDWTYIFEAMARKYLRTEPITVKASLDLGIKIHYQDPTAVGADRLCNAIAGFRRFKGPLIIIDFGTATTFDVVGKNGDYLGGVIALGLESSASELHRKAAKLPRIELHFPDRVVGTDTETSMKAGLMFGTLDGVEGIVNRINAELGEKARVIATGGLAGIMAEHTTIIEEVVPSLVLEGIRLVYERVRKLS
ncbi:MAG TPA: type III pantothenate kinase [Bacteroidota bacterium]